MEALVYRVFEFVAKWGYWYILNVDSLDRLCKAVVVSLHTVCYKVPDGVGEVGQALCSRVGLKVYFLVNRHAFQYQYLSLAIESPFSEKGDSLDACYNIYEWTYTYDPPHLKSSILYPVTDLENNEAVNEINNAMASVYVEGQCKRILCSTVLTWFLSRGALSVTTSLVMFCNLYRSTRWRFRQTLSDRSMSYVNTPHTDLPPLCYRSETPSR